MLFKAAVVTLWTFVEYILSLFLLRPLACSAAQSSRLGEQLPPLPLPIGYATG